MLPFAGAGESLDPAVSENFMTGSEKRWCILKLKMRPPRLEQWTPKKEIKKMRGRRRSLKKQNIMLGREGQKDSCIGKERVGKPQIKEITKKKKQESGLFWVEVLWLGSRRRVVGGWWWGWGGSYKCDDSARGECKNVLDFVSEDFVPTQGFCFHSSASY